MLRILYITNLGRKRMAYRFCGTTIEAGHSLRLEIVIVANRSQATRKDIVEDEEKYNV